MRFGGLYNFGGGGTEVIVGNGTANTPSHKEVISGDPMMFFSGQFTNLSMELIHVTLKAQGIEKLSGIAAMHKHDLRPRESLNVIMIPISELSVIINSTNSIGFHGMGAMWIAQDMDEYAVMASKSMLTEGGSVPATFNTDSYNRVSPTTATTQDLIASGEDNDFALKIITFNVDAAGIVDLFWTDAGNSNIHFIGTYQFTAAGTYSFGFDWLRNPNRQGGKLRCTQTLANWKIDAIGHLVHAGQ